MLRALLLLLVLTATDPFYVKQRDAGGIPIRSSAQVPDEALRRARSIVSEMLGHRPDLHRALVLRGQTVSILGEAEAITDLPENRHWRKPARDDPRLTRCERIHYDARIGRLTDRQYWNARARGIGGVNLAGAAEDLLGLPSSRYFGESIFVHEFAHSVLDAIEIADPQLYAEVRRAYRAALAAAKWKDEYASTTVQEYWAEGTQTWFDTNRLMAFDGRRILDHGDLAAYDPALYALLRRAYGNRHRLTDDPFWQHPARVPPGPPPVNTAEVC